MTDNDPMAPRRQTQVKTMPIRPVPNLAPLSSTIQNVINGLNCSESLVQTKVKPNKHTRKSDSRLTPISKTDRSADRRIEHTTLGSEMMNAQIRINAEVMKEVEALRAEKMQLLADVDKVAKEKEYFKMKLATASEQLSYLKKKVVKKANVDENRDPKLIKIKSAFDAKPLRERECNFRDSSVNPNKENAGSKTLDMPLNDGIREQNPKDTGLNDAKDGDKQNPSKN